MKPTKSKQLPKRQLMDRQTSDNLQLENSQLIYGIVQWSFCIIGSILFYGCIGYLVSKYYHPDTTDAVRIALEKCIVDDFHPEPVEALLYRLGLILIPSFLLFFYWLTTLPFFKKIAERKGVAYSLMIMASVGIAFLTYYVFSQANPTFLDTVGRLHNERDRIADTNFVFFFKDTFLETHLGQYLLLWVTFLLLFYLFVAKFFRGIGLKIYSVLTSIILFAVAAIIFLQIFNMMHFELPLNWENQYDLNAVFYSVTQVNAGGQLLVDGFTNTYGLYPHFIQPFFSIFGLSVSNFTLVMSVLVVFTFFATLLFLYANVQDKLFVILGFTTCVYFPFLLNRLVMNFDATFALIPIRTTPVAMLLLCSTLYIFSAQRQKKLAMEVVYYAGSVLLAFCVIWNFEFGLVSYISWLAFLCYHGLFTNEKRINWKKL